jgi:hypothetical protein
MKQGPRLDSAIVHKEDKPDLFCLEVYGLGILIISASKENAR